jgi:hypothetical protein
MLLGAAALLGAGVLVIAIHGLSRDSLTPMGWLIVTLVGIVFVGAQMVSALMMVSLAAENVASGSLEASDRRINDRNSHESKTSARP